MKQMPLYKVIEGQCPGVISEILSPTRLRLLADPQMIQSLISIDEEMEKIKDAVKEITKQDH